MIKRNFELTRSFDHKQQSCRCSVLDSEAPYDTELEHLFRDLALTLYGLMAPDNVDILIRTDLYDQTLYEIASQIGCTRAEAARRLNQAQRCFCELVILTLAPAEFD